MLWYTPTARQPLVDAAYLAESFLRAPELWNELDEYTKKRYIECFNLVKIYEPYKSNWLLFSGIIECFFVMIGENYNERKMFNYTWYVGDGWYSDGKYFAMNYYNSFIIHPMLIQMLEIMEKNNIRVP